MSRPCQSVFVSFTGSDRTWAEWIANVLARNGYVPEGQHWSRESSSNFLGNIHKSLETCDRFVAVLSAQYLRSDYCQMEWTSALARDRGQTRFIVPVMVEPCKPNGLLGPLTYVDLGKLSSAEGEVELLKALSESCGAPPAPPDFPAEEPPYHAYFPNEPSSEIALKYEELLSREYPVLVRRRHEPSLASRTSALLYGTGFPFGKKAVIPEISRYSLFLDIRKLLNATVGSYKSDQLHDVATSGPHVLYKAASCRWRVHVCAVADGLDEFRADLLVQPILDGLKRASLQRSPTDELLATARRYLDSGIEGEQARATTRQLLRLIGEVAARSQLTLEDMLNEEQKNYRKENLGSRARPKPRATYVVTLYFSDEEGTYDKILKALASRHVNIVTSKSWTLNPGEVAYAKLKIACAPDLAVRDELDKLGDTEDLRDLLFKLRVSDDKVPKRNKR